MLIRCCSSGAACDVGFGSWRSAGMFANHPVISWRSVSSVGALSGGLPRYSSVRRRSCCSSSSRGSLGSEPGVLRSGEDQGWRLPEWSPMRRTPTTQTTPEELPLWHARFALRRRILAHARSAKTHHTVPRPGPHVSSSENTPPHSSPGVTRGERVSPAVPQRGNTLAVSNASLKVCDHRIRHRMRTSLVGDDGTPCAIRLAPGGGCRAARVTASTMAVGRTGPCHARALVRPAGHGWPAGMRSPCVRPRRFRFAVSGREEYLERVRRLLDGARPPAPPAIVRCEARIQPTALFDRFGGGRRRPKPLNASAAHASRSRATRATCPPSVRPSAVVRIASRTGGVLRPGTAAGVVDGGGQMLAERVQDVGVGGDGVPVLAGPGAEVAACVIPPQAVGLGRPTRCRVRRAPPRWCPRSVGSPGPPDVPLDPARLTGSQQSGAAPAGGIPARASALSTHARSNEVIGVCTVPARPTVASDRGSPGRSLPRRRRPDRRARPRWPR